VFSYFKFERCVEIMLCLIYVKLNVRICNEFSWLWTGASGRLVNVLIL